MIYIKKEKPEDWRNKIFMSDFHSCIYNLLMLSSNSFDKTITVCAKAGFSLFWISIKFATGFCLTKQK